MRSPTPPRPHQPLPLHQQGSSPSSLWILFQKKMKHRLSRVQNQKVLQKLLIGLMTRQPYQSAAHCCCSSVLRKCQLQTMLMMLQQVPASAKVLLCFLYCCVTLSSREQSGCCFQLGLVLKISMYTVETSRSAVASTSEVENLVYRCK